jgi:hypothetical protein
MRRPPPAALDLDEGRSLPWSEIRAALTKRQQDLAERIATREECGVELIQWRAEYRLLGELLRDPYGWLLGRRGE